MTAHLSDADLLLRLTNFEDHFVERKTTGDSKDWLKTVVSFANSAPVGYPALLYIGVRDGGQVEAGVNLDSLQKTLSKKLEDAYPPIFYMPKVLKKDRNQFLAVIVPGSQDRPHFAGPSYIRVGSETGVASESQFAALIAQRGSKVREILRWTGKQSTISYMNTADKVMLRGPVMSTDVLTVVDCNDFYVTLSRAVSGGSGQAASEQICPPLNRTEISYDGGQNRLKFEVTPL